MLPSSCLFLFFFFPLGTSTTRKISKAPAFESVRSKEEENWRRRAIDILWSERRRWGHTPLVRVPLAGYPNVDLVFKDESATPTKSLKHRFAWSLIFWGILEGKVPKTITKEMAANLVTFGARLVRVAGIDRKRESLRLAAKPNHFLVNQLANAEKAIGSFESGNFSFESENLFHELLAQLHYKAPDYFIQSVGSGGTITSIGRYVHRYNLPTRIVLADGEFSLLYDYAKSGYFTTIEEDGHSQWRPPGVPGTGFGYQEDPVEFGSSSSLLRSVIDEVAKIPNIATTAAVRVLQRLRTDKKKAVDGGPSTALNFLVALTYAQRHKGTPKKHTTIASIICDPNSNYGSTFLNDTWIGEHIEGGVSKMKCWEEAIEKAVATGGDFLELGKKC